MAVISPDLIADTEAYASTITRSPAEPHIDYGARKIKLLREHFPFDCTASESAPLMSVDPSGTIGVVHLPAILSSRLRRQVKQGLQALQDAGITDQHPCGWAYGWGNPIVELTDSGLCGGPPVRRPQLSPLLSDPFHTDSATPPLRLRKCGMAPLSHFDTGHILHHPRDPKHFRPRRCGEGDGHEGPLWDVIPYKSLDPSALRC